MRKTPDEGVQSVKPREDFLAQSLYGGDVDGSAVANQTGELWVEGQPGQHDQER